MSPKQLTPEQQADLCVEALKKAKVDARLSGREMPWSDVRESILGVLRTPKNDHSPFGIATKIPPQPEWVTAYSASIGYPMNGEAWCDSYAAKGWQVGKARMKNWQCACRNWRTNDWGRGGIALAGATSAKAEKDYARL
jgi:hypothetical protein